MLCWLYSIVHTFIFFALPWILIWMWIGISTMWQCGSNKYIIHLVTLYTCGLLLLFQLFVKRLAFAPSPHSHTPQALRGLNDSSSGGIGDLDWALGIHRPTDVDIRQGMWQAQRLIDTRETTDNAAFAMHAYYDDRPMLNGSHYIRLFLVLARTSVKALHQSPQCYLWSDNYSHPITTAPKIISTDARPTKVNRRYYSHILLSCPVPESLQFGISHVSFAPANITRLTVYIPVTYPVKNHDFVHTFGHCQANGISFGYVGDDQARWMVEWIEANRLFGIKQFNLYNGTMQVGPLFQKVLNYYRKLGVLRMYQQHPPLAEYDPTDRASADLAMRTAFNDCMYRNMYRYKYIVSVDMDEIIVPKKQSNYFQILASLKPILSMNNYSSIIFQSKAFYQSILGQPQNVSSDVDLTVTKYIKHVQDGRVKPFIDPRLCLAGFSHYCLQNFQFVKKITVSSTKELAEVHHYRNQCYKENTALDASKCEKMWSKNIINRRMGAFAPKIFLKVKSVWELLHI